MADLENKEDDVPISTVITLCVAIVFGSAFVLGVAVKSQEAGTPRVTTSTPAHTCTQRTFWNNCKVSERLLCRIAVATEFNLSVLPRFVKEDTAIAVRSVAGLYYGCNASEGNVTLFWQAGGGRYRHAQLTYSVKGDALTMATKQGYAKAYTISN